MNIYQMQHEAEDRMTDGRPMNFALINRQGVPISAEWLDPFFGLVRIAGQDGFCRVEDLSALGITEAEWTES